MNPDDNMPEYYNRQGREISMEQWVALGSDREYKILAVDDYGYAKVSTVWLGLNHAFDPLQSPLIFETMIFGGEFDGETWRYSTEKEALEGHANALKLITPLIAKDEYIND